MEFLQLSHNRFTAVHCLYLYRSCFVLLDLDLVLHFKVPYIMFL